jgi:MoaA/NifB/PqqE/SkfB family radical SAM enzyme
MVSIDIEPTNRCNAKCHFCPRDQTPHQGLMTTEVFDRSLQRAIEFRALAADALGLEVEVSLCGLGEPLLNPNTPTFVAQLRDAGFTSTLSTNATLLDERRGRALLDAGINGMAINVGEVGDDYERVYQLPFQRTYENIVRFAEMAGEQCRIQIVLVDHRQDNEHTAHMMRFWTQRGLKEFFGFPIMNRGGALSVDHMQYETLPEVSEARERLAQLPTEPVCYAPFNFLFIGYDGQYYLCGADWKKEAPLGSVFEKSFIDVTHAKLQHVISREPICKTCNHDPRNRYVDQLRAIDDGTEAAADGEALVRTMIAETDEVMCRVAMFERLGADRAGAVVGRRRIPVTAE